MARPRAGPAPQLRPLSARERQVLERVARLETNAEIAAGLGVGPETVKTHLRHIYRKLEAPHRRGAVRRWGAQRGAGEEA